MAELTAIEWCDATLNLWWGCTKVSDGCKNCYAETLTNRYGRNNWGPNGVRQEVKSWRSTLAKVSKRAMAEQRRLRVFVQSMSDTFEGPETMGGIDSQNWETTNRLRGEFIRLVFDHPELDFLVLTKRPENVLPNWPFIWPTYEFPSNWWMGTSVEDQKTADERIPHLLRVPAAVRFLSCEPLLSGVNLSAAFHGYPEPVGGGHLGYVSRDMAIDAGDPSMEGSSLGYIEPDWVPTHEPDGIHWVITGGESGPKRRPCDLEWMRSLRDQCKAAGVPFFGKQWDKVRSLPEDLLVREFPRHKHGESLL